MASGSYKKHTSLLNGEILLYILAGSTNNIWQVRFLNRLDNGKRYIRKSTKHRDLTMATSVAMDLYRQHQSKLTLGLKDERVTLEVLVEEFLKDSQYNKSRKELVAYHYKTYWIKFFNNNDISTINSDDIKEYLDWRLDNNHTMEKGAGWKSSEETTSFSSINHDRICLRMVLQLGEQRRRLVKVPRFPRVNRHDPRVHQLPSNQSRGRFTPEAYEIVQRDFIKISNALNKRAWMPSVMKLEGKHDPDTNPYVSVGQRRSRSYRKFKGLDYGSEAQIYCHRDKRYLRATWWFLALLIANSGCRPAEAIKLRWKDIRLIESDGKYYTTINISENVSKTGRRRLMVCRDGYETYKRLLKYKREVCFRFNISDVKDTDWVFPSTSRKHSYKKFKTTSEYGDLSRQNFKRLGMHTQELTLLERDTSKNAKIYFSLYSFRSFYISERLRNRMNIWTLSKQVGSSVATLMKHYEFNDMLAFRDEMVKHINENYTFSDLDDEIRSHAVPWR